MLVTIEGAASRTQNSAVEAPIGAFQNELYFPLFQGANSDCAGSDPAAVFACKTSAPNLIINASREVFRHG